MENYQTKFVAFIDVLGFKELVAQSASDDGTFIQIMNSIYHPEHSHGMIHVEISNFSDSFVFSCCSNLMYFEVLISLVNKLYLKMLELGTLARGGISVGSMYHDDGMAFGPAFLDAYHLENTVARYPRIVLGKRTLDEIQSLAAKDEGRKHHSLEKWLCRDDDGVVYLDQFAEFDTAFSDQDPDERDCFANKAGLIRSHLAKKCPKR